MGGAAFYFGAGTDLVELAHLTVHDVRAGIEVEEAPVDLFAVRDSVFARVQDTALQNHEANNALEVGYSAFDRVGEVQVGPVVLGEGILEGDDARCLDRDAELALAEDSACVDAGTPGDAFCGEEPGGDACRADLGHLGGTADAQAR